MKGPFVNHIHVFPRRVRRDATPDLFAAFADELGIAGGVFFAPLPHQWPDGDPNGWLVRELRRHRTYLGFGTLDPQKPARDQVSRIADLGLLGAKIHGPAQHFPLNCEWIMDAYAQMERLDLIADIHLGVHGYRLKDYHPQLLDEVAHRFPELCMILEHVGGWHFVRDAVAVIANHQQASPAALPATRKGDPVREGVLYAGITSVLDRQGMPAYYLGPEGVAEIAWQVGNDHLIYGSDFPYSDRDRLAKDLAAIRGMGLPPEDMAGLLGDNLRRILDVS